MAGKLLKRSVTAFSTTIMRPARSALAYSDKLARWAWRGSFQSIGTAPINPAYRRIGSRSKTPNQPIGARRKDMLGNLVKVSTNVTGATFGSPFMIPPNAP
jgi:hypothetical protein